MLSVKSQTMATILRRYGFYLLYAFEVLNQMMTIFHRPVLKQNERIRNVLITVLCYVANLEFFNSLDKNICVFRNFNCKIRTTVLI